MPVPAPTSRDRLLAAAAAEFAARGFDGAKVDRIAARARLNKAMLYYHFRNKAALYREILRDLFRSIGEATTGVRAQGGDPESQLRSFIRAVAAEAASRPHFPPIWLREMAEGGRHLDGSIVAEMRRTVGALAGILAEGQQAGRFRPANPFAVQLAIVSPLVMYAASRPLRERFARALPPSVTASSPEAVLDQVEAATLASLSLCPADAGRSAPPPSRRHES